MIELPTYFAVASANTEIYIYIYIRGCGSVSGDFERDAVQVQLDAAFV